MKLPAIYRQLLGHEQLAALAHNPDTTPTWLLDLCILAYHSGLSIADIASIKWRELVVTTELAKQVIKVVRNADDIEYLTVHQLNEEAMLLLQIMVKTGHASTESEYFFTSASRDEISTYEKPIYDLIMVLKL